MIDYFTRKGMMSSLTMKDVAWSIAPFECKYVSSRQPKGHQINLENLETTFSFKFT